MQTAVDGKGGGDACGECGVVVRRVRVEFM